jgi:hypothetical protein
MPAERIAIIGKLKPGALERAEEIVKQGPPFELDMAGLERHSVFVSHDHVVFVFEGLGVERIVADLANHPVVAAEFSTWGPLLDGTPTLAHERFSWASEPEAS